MPLFSRAYFSTVHYFRDNRGLALSLCEKAEWKECRPLFDGKTYHWCRDCEARA